jgi:hypothetical protein
VIQSAEPFGRLDHGLGCCRAPSELEVEMDLKKHQFRTLLVSSLLAATGCVAPQPPVPTVWQRLGVAQAGARMRDGLVNRHGNFPGLERKPPVLALADPANLAPEMPDMIKAAAEIKQDQDLKKQKIKAIKFLAEVNCGCYDADGKVEAAFLAALEDCDPDVRKAGIEGLSKAAGECSRCRTGCEVTCCTKKILKKLDDIANGMEKGCYKEPVEEIRQAARLLLCKCPVPSPDPIVPEELIAPEPQKKSSTPPRESLPEEAELGAEVIEVTKVFFSLSDDAYGEYDLAPVVVGASHSSGRPARSVSSSKATTTAAVDRRTTSVDRISNPEQLVSVNVVSYRRSLGELLIQLPDAYELGEGWTVIIIDEAGNQSLARISDVGGRRILLDVERPTQMTLHDSGRLKLGLVSR